MSYDAEKSRRLIRQTDSAGQHATTAEIERANQLQAADDRITILEREKADETKRADSNATALNAWQHSFGTTQLSHAIARLEAAEKKAK